jgi:hypothetical protein
VDACNGQGDPAEGALAAALAGLIRLPGLIERLAEAIERLAAAPAPPGPAGPIPTPGLVELGERLEKLTGTLGQIGRPDRRLTYRRVELAEALGISDRLLERAIHAKEAPAPDARCGAIPLWSRQAVDAWLNRTKINGK